MNIRRGLQLVAISSRTVGQFLRYHSADRDRTSGIKSLRSTGHCQNKIGSIAEARDLIVILKSRSPLHGPLILMSTTQVTRQRIPDSQTNQYSLIPSPAEVCANPSSNSTFLASVSRLITRKFVKGSIHEPKSTHRMISRVARTRFQ